MCFKSFRKSNSIQAKYTNYLGIMLLVIATTYPFFYFELDLIKFYALPILGLGIFAFMVATIFSSKTFNPGLVQTRFEFELNEYNLLEIVEMFERVGILLSKKVGHFYIFDLLGSNYKGYRVILCEESEKCVVVGPKKAINIIKSLIGSATKMLD